MATPGDPQVTRTPWEKFVYVPPSDLTEDQIRQMRVAVEEWLALHPDSAESDPK